MERTTQNIPPLGRDTTLQRIAYCITELDVGGAEKCLFELVTRLDRERFEPHVFALKGPGPIGDWLGQRDIPVTYLGDRKRTAAVAVWRLARHLRRGDFALLHTFLFHGNLVGRLAAAMAGLRPVISTIRVAERRGSLHLILDHWTHRLCDLELCVSEDVMHFTRRFARIPRHKLDVIPNGVDVDRFATAPPADWPSLGVPAEAPVALFVGRLEAQKAPEQLVFALATLVRDGRDRGLQAVFVGTGSASDQVGRLALRQNLGSRVHLLGHRRDVPELMRASDLVVLPSRWEGMANVALEAMAAACPLAATDVEGMRDIVPPPLRPTLLEPDDTPALADRIAEILAAPDRASEQARVGQGHVRRHFSLEPMVHAYQDTYLRLLETGS